MFQCSQCKISDKSDKFLLNYSNLIRDPLFSGHSVYSAWLQANIPKGIHFDLTPKSDWAETL